MRVVNRTRPDHERAATLRTPEDALAAAFRVLNLAPAPALACTCAAEVPMCRQAINRPLPSVSRQIRVASVDGVFRLTVEAEPWWAFEASDAVRLARGILGVVDALAVADPAAARAFAREIVAPLGPAFVLETSEVEGWLRRFRQDTTPSIPEEV